jgi:hypothetical protein
MSSAVDKVCDTNLVSTSFEKLANRFMSGISVVEGRIRIGPAGVELDDIPARG